MLPNRLRARRSAHPPLHIGFLLAAGVLVGCAPQPSLTPTPTSTFANKRDALAAAEKVYREFTRYLNQIDVSDPSTFEPLFRLSTGEFQAADRKAYSAMHAEGFTVDGETKIISFVGISSERPFDHAVADVCLDVTSVVVLDAEGTSRVSPDRPDFSALRVTFQQDKEGKMLIASATRREDPTCGAS